MYCIFMMSMAFRSIAHQMKRIVDELRVALESCRKVVNVKLMICLVIALFIVHGGVPEDEESIAAEMEHAREKNGGVMRDRNQY